MSTDAERARDRAAEQLANIIAARTRSDRVAGFTIPFFSAHPDPGNPTNFWAFMGDATVTNNRLHIRRPDGVVMSFYADSIAAGTTATGTLPSEADVELFSTIYPAVWGRTFCDIHGLETGTLIGYGYSTGHDYRRVMIGFDDATIPRRPRRIRHPIRRVFDDQRGQPGRPGDHMVRRSQTVGGALELLIHAPRNLV